LAQPETNTRSAPKAKKMHILFIFISTNLPFLVALPEIIRQKLDK